VGLAAAALAEHGITTAALCREARLDPSTLRAWRTGKRNPSPASITKVVLAFSTLTGVSEQEARDLLFSFSEEEERRCPHCGGLL
jgi:transcriptional regulator with XRE-family HTH domain